MKDKFTLEQFENYLDDALFPDYRKVKEHVQSKEFSLMSLEFWRSLVSSQPNLGPAIVALDEDKTFLFWNYGFLHLNIFIGYNGDVSWIGRLGDEIEFGYLDVRDHLTKELLYWLEKIAKEKNSKLIW